MNKYTSLNAFNQYFSNQIFKFEAFRLWERDIYIIKVKLSGHSPVDVCLQHIQSKYTSIKYY